MELTGHHQTGESLCDHEYHREQDVNRFEGTGGDWWRPDLAELIDIPAIQAMLDDFYRLTHIPVCLTDFKSRPLVGAGWQKVCLQFHRAHPATRQHCLASDLLQTADLPPGEFKLYKCLNNMWDISTPLLVAGQHVGNLFTGQFFFDDEPLDEELFRGQARRYGFDEHEYLAALNDVPRLSRQTAQNGMAFLLKLAHMISQLSYVNLRLARRDALFENILEGFSYCRMLYEEGQPRDYIHLDVNGSFETLTGLKDVIGRKISEVIPGLRESNPELFEIYGRVARTGKPEKFETYLAALGLWFAIAVYSPRPEYFVVIFDNITERKRTEETLRMTQFSVDHASEGLFWMDPAGRIISANESACRTLGYTREELLGLSIPELDPNFSPEIWQDAWAELKACGSMNFETHHRARDGRIISVEIASNYIEFAGREYSCAFVRDITERKRAEDERRQLEAQLHQLQKMEAVGQLAGGVAHDFNNLLTVILGYSETLLAHLPPADPHRDDIVNIKAAGERAAALTRQLLAFSRKQILAPKVIDLNVVVREIEKMIRRLIGEDIVLTTHLDPDISQVMVDPGQIEQVILNLAVNARDAMPHGGHLTIETGACVLDDDYCLLHPASRPGRHCLLSITDTGCGMSPEIKARLFEPFFTTKGLGKGTGLGLATVFGVVRQSGGTIEVDSEEDVGSCFRVYLPAVQSDAAALESGPVLSAAPRGSETILVVEDEESVRQIIRRTLEMQGYHVLEAANGPQAVAMAESTVRPIHLLVTDIVMPAMSGRQVVQVLRARYAGLKVLYMSGYTDDAIVRHGVIESNVAFLQKPFALRELAKKVRAVLDGQA